MHYSSFLFSLIQNIHSLCGVSCWHATVAGFQEILLLKKPHALQKLQALLEKKRKVTVGRTSPDLRQQAARDSICTVLGCSGSSPPIPQPFN